MWIIWSDAFKTGTTKHSVLCLLTKLDHKQNVGVGSETGNGTRRAELTDVICATVPPTVRILRRSLKTLRSGEKGSTGEREPERLECFNHGRNSLTPAIHQGATLEARGRHTGKSAEHYISDMQLVATASNTITALRPAGGPSLSHGTGDLGLASWMLCEQWEGQRQQRVDVLSSAA